MSRHQRIPCALTVAGSDSGGGAGVQADLKTFAATGVHGVSAITCLTAQNPEKVQDIQACSTRMLNSQLEAIEPFEPRAMKTGMLYSKPLIEAIAAFVCSHPGIKLVVDPVMIATSGAMLLKPQAIKSLETLIRRSTLLTPNIAEAEVLSGSTISRIGEQRNAAHLLHDRFGCAVLIKGGHMPGTTEVTDVFFDGRKQHLLAARRVRNVATHGTGCTLSAAITAHLARGRSLLNAVKQGKEFTTEAIAASVRVGKYDVLNPFSL